MTIGAAAMMLLCAPLAKPDASYLPIVQKNGENCYYYSVERGESVYGIVKRFDWDAEVFMRYNPNASELKGGQVVYYPCVVKEKKDEPDRTNISFSRVTGVGEGLTEIFNTSLFASGSLSTLPPFVSNPEILFFIRLVR